MKLTIFALIAGLCVVAVTASGGAVMLPTNTEDIEYIPEDFADGIVEVESFGAIGVMYSILKGSLRTLKGVNCSIKSVFLMRDAAQNFLDNINACGAQTTKQLQSLITSCTNVVSTCNDIINYNSKTCNGDSYNAETDANNKTGWTCFWKLLKKFLTLKKQLNTAISSAKKVPAAPGQAGVCVTNSINKLTGTFLSFPTYIKSCSKLTSN